MKKRFLTTFIGIFLAIVLVLGGALVISVGVKNANAVVKCGNVMLDEGTVNYLISYYKSLYFKELNTAGIAAHDSDSFWASEGEDGKSYGEHFQESVREYIASVVAAANIYITNATYTPDDKLSVGLTCEDILKYKAEGDVSVFNDRTEKRGFDYNDFQNAAALLYKAQRATVVLYGDRGKYLRNFPEKCEKYFDTYSHVKLLFLRDETLVETDEEGNVSLRDMTDEERAERLALAEEIRDKIESGAMTPDAFEIYLEKSDADPVANEKEYYFHESADATSEFAVEFPTIVNASLEMNVGEYIEVDTSAGICFICKCENTDGAYAEEDNPFFSDFYADAALYLYSEMLSEFVGEVKFKTAYDEIDVLSIPMTEEFYIVEFKSVKK